MVVQLSRAGEALVVPADHCTGCARCKPDLDAPRTETRPCPRAKELYRVWKAAWAREHRR
jgi:hypothetical protein